MTGFLRTASTPWRNALRAGALAAALAVVAGAPLAAQARDWHEHGGRGHEHWEHHEWHHGYRGYYGPRVYDPAYGYYYAPGYAPYYPAPGVSLGVTIP